MADMSDYLSDVAADYTAEELDIPPHNEISFSGEKEQFVHKFSDGQRGVVTMSSTSYFTVTLEWYRLGPDNAGFIMDLFHNENKANGIARSFYWKHPGQETRYTVKFAEPLSQSFKASQPGFTGYRQITLAVVGNKP
jgi:hypothetical protein